MRSISQWWSGTKAFALLNSREAAGHDVLVSPEKSAQRAAVCVSCEPHNEVPTDLGWLEKWANGKMRQRIGDSTTPHDEKLGVCKLCSCELRTIVHFDADILRQTTSASTLTKLPEHCWKRKELE